MNWLIHSIYPDGTFILMELLNTKDKKKSYKFLKTILTETFKVLREKGLISVLLL